MALNDAIRKCPDCGDRITLVRGLTGGNRGKVCNPPRLVCRCGKLVKA